MSSLEQTNFINDFVEQYKKKPSMVTQSLQMFNPQVHESQRTIESKAGSVLDDAKLLSKEYNSRKIGMKRASSSKKLFKIY